MKHLLNDLSQEEKNSILEQHSGGKELTIENFQKMVNKKLGDVPTFLNEGKSETCEQCGNELTEGGECMECGSVYEEETTEGYDTEWSSNSGLELGGLLSDALSEISRELYSQVDTTLTHQEVENILSMIYKWMSIKTGVKFRG